MKYDGPLYLNNRLPFVTKDDLPGGGFISVKFLYIIDGDTASFIIDNKAVIVRFLAIDTPEVKTNQQFSDDAKTYTYNMLKHAKTIYLQSEPNDSLHDNMVPRRLLAWVWVDNRLLNYLLVAKGYANIKYVYSDKLLYLKQLQNAEAIAKQKRLRIYEKEVS